MNWKWLCKIGIHKWEWIGMSLMYDRFEECLRCKMRRRLVAFSGYIYSKEPKDGWTNGPGKGGAKAAMPLDVHIAVGPEAIDRVLAADARRKDLED